MNRHHELESLRRSLSMLSPGQHALRSEDALQLLAELVEVQDHLDRLGADLRALAESS